jgi:hypothetical protein
LLATLAGCAGELDPTGFTPPAGIAYQGGAGMGGSQDGGTPAAPDTGGGGGSGPCDPAPIFAEKACVACHDKTGAFGGFDMATAGWEARMVGMAPKGGGSATPSVCATGGRVYLVAGSAPATGLFLDKLKAKTASLCGDTMPLALEPMTPTELDCVQRWANGLTKP